MSMLEGAASGLVTAGVQQMFTDYNREQDFENYKEAQEQNYINAQDMQRNAPMLTKLGMAAAGLNPANMSNPSPASPDSAPLAHHDAPSIDFAASINAMSDANLKDAQAEQINLQNENMRGENEGAYQNYIQQAKQVINLYRERGWTQQADAIQEDLDNLQRLEDEGKLNFNVGNLRGAVMAFNTVESLQNRLSMSLEEALKTETNFKMLLNGSSVPLSQMPQVQRDLLVRQASNYMAQTALFMSQKELTAEQKNEVLKMEKKLQSDIDEAVARKELTEVQAKSIRLADWKQLLNDKDFLAAAIAKADENQKILMQQLGQFAGAAAHMYAGSKMANGMSRQGQSTTSTTIQKYDKAGNPKGSDHIHSTTNNSSSMLRNGIPSIEESGVIW